MQHWIPEECITFYSLMATGQPDSGQIRRIKIDAPMTMQPCDVYRGKYGFLALHMKMLQFYLEGQVGPFVVVVTTAEHARSVRALFGQVIQKEFPEVEAARRLVRIKMLTGNYKGNDDRADNNMEEEWNKKLKRDPNDAETLRECDVLIYNTALQAGTSIESQYFQTAFEFLQTGLLTSRDEFQLTSRLRHIPYGKKFVWIQHSKDTIETPKISIQQQAHELLGNVDNVSMTEGVKRLVTIAWSVQISELLHTRVYHFENYRREYIKATGSPFREFTITEKPSDYLDFSIDWINLALNSEFETRNASISENNNNTNADPSMTAAMHERIKSMINDPDDADAFNVVANAWDKTKRRRGVDPRSHFCHVHNLHAYLDFRSNNHQWQLRRQIPTNNTGEFETVVMKYARLLDNILQALQVDPLHQFDRDIDPPVLRDQQHDNRRQAVLTVFHIEGPDAFDEHGNPTLATASNLLSHTSWFQTYPREEKFSLVSHMTTALGRCGIPCVLRKIGKSKRKYRVNKPSFILHLCVLKAIVGPTLFQQYQSLFDQTLWNQVDEKYTDLSHSSQPQLATRQSELTDSDPSRV